MLHFFKFVDTKTRLIDMKVFFDLCSNSLMNKFFDVNKCITWFFEIISKKKTNNESRDNMSNYKNDWTN